MIREDGLVALLLWRASEVLVSVGLLVTLTVLLHQFVSLRRDRASLSSHAAVLSKAVRELTSLRDSDEVVAAAVRLAAELISPAAGDGRRAVYFVIQDDIARVVAEFDDSGRQAMPTVALVDHPALARVVETHAPLRTTFPSPLLGPTASRSVARTRITHGAAVPILVNGLLHGVLAVGGRGRPIEAFDRLIDLGGVVELALANALVTQELERQATTDPLTGCANRRGLRLASQLLSDREPLAVIAADLDGLKALNDRAGHDAGDVALAKFAAVVRAQVRPGDVLARVGGDEFVVLMHNTAAEEAVAVARRIVAALNAAGAALGASLGVASASGPEGFDVACREADQAMYQAKALGGWRFVVAGAEGTEPPHTGVASA